MFEYARIKSYIFKMQRKEVDIMNKKDNIFTEEEKKSLEFLIRKRDEAYGLMQFEDGELYQLAEEEFNNYLTIEEIIDKQQKEIKELKSKTQIISPLYIKENYISKEAIREKIKELEQVKYDEGKYDEKNSIYGYIYEFSKSYEYEVAQIIIKILKELLGE